MQTEEAERATNGAKKVIHKIKPREASLSERLFDDSRRPPDKRYVVNLAAATSWDTFCGSMEQRLSCKDEANNWDLENRSFGRRIRKERDCN
ncbi:hypothetical protein K7X08_020137 [Anisodus acutangulus]|uniref:Uncharacterized protein n=1 Tax=Anisodus acutangulus TaxID=402998 RepID=A0A9Q1REP4_9SOLA|nr:hypothetical protein K7X08_020137 [Anisodus acutangulus]